MYQHATCQAHICIHSNSMVQSAYSVWIDTHNHTHNHTHNRTHTQNAIHGTSLKNCIVY